MFKVVNKIKGRLGLKEFNQMYFGERGHTLYYGVEIYNIEKSDRGFVTSSSYINQNSQNNNFQVRCVDGMSIGNLWDHLNKSCGTVLEYVEYLLNAEKKKVFYFHTFMELASWLNTHDKVETEIVSNSTDVEITPEEIVNLSKAPIIGVVKAPIKQSYPVRVGHVISYKIGDTQEFGIVEYSAENALNGVTLYKYRIPVGSQFTITNYMDALLKDGEYKVFAFPSLLMYSQFAEKVLNGEITFASL